MCCEGTESGYKEEDSRGAWEEVVQVEFVGCV